MLLHPNEGDGGVVEFLEWEVEFPQRGVDAGEFDVMYAQPLEADAFLGNAL